MDGVSDKAYEDCEQSRQKANILAKCSVYAVNDKIYYREPSELVKSPLETPSPSTPPAYKEPSPVPKPDLKKKQEISYGTGFAVRGDGYILTSYHIISGADSIAVSYQSRKHVTAKLIKHSSTNDIALLKINEKTPQYLELEEPGNVNIGERVFTIGFPVMELLGAEPKYSEGTISSLAGFYDEASFMQISVPVQPGNSGGPLLNEKGKVVGIITATAAVSRFLKTTGTLPQNVNWAVKADIARTLFKAPKPSKTSKFERQAIISRARDSVCIIGVIKTE
jgi:S1-C subfamily serine protease